MKYNPIFNNQISIMQRFISTSRNSIRKFSSVALNQSYGAGALVYVMFVLQFLSLVCNAQFIIFI